jgi:hypothetical protein
MTDVQKVTLEFTVDELNVVFGGLGELQAKISLGLIEKIRSQAVSQLQPAPPPAAPAPETPAASAEG